MRIEQPPSPLNKAFFWILGIIMVAFLISVPFMIRDNSRLRDEQWQQEHCDMYKDDTISEIPAKCNNDFTEHEPRMRGER